MGFVAILINFAAIPTRFFLFKEPLLQPRKAYRHLNGGSTAPSLREHGKARPVRNELQNELAEKMLKLQEPVFQHQLKLFFSFFFYIEIVVVIFCCCLFSSLKLLKTFIIFFSFSVNNVASSMIGGFEWLSRKEWFWHVCQW